MDVEHCHTPVWTCHSTFVFFFGGSQAHRVFENDGHMVTSLGYPAESISNCLHFLSNVKLDVQTLHQRHALCEWCSQLSGLTSNKPSDNRYLTLVIEPFSVDIL